MILLDRLQHAVQALASEPTPVEQPAMTVDAEAAPELPIRVTNRELLGEVRVGDEMSSVGDVQRVYGECGVTRPLAIAVRASAVDAPRARLVRRPHAGRHDRKRDKPWYEHRFHALSLRDVDRRLQYKNPIG